VDHQRKKREKLKPVQWNWNLIICLLTGMIIFPHLNLHGLNRKVAKMVRVTCTEYHFKSSQKYTMLDVISFFRIDTVLIKLELAMSNYDIISRAGLMRSAADAIRTCTCIDMYTIRTLLIQYLPIRIRYLFDTVYVYMTLGFKIKKIGFQHHRECFGLIYPTNTLYYRAKAKCSPV